MTAFDMETADRFGAPYIAVIGNNSAMNQIRYGQIAKYGPQRGDIGNKLGDVEFSKFAHMLDGHGEEVREASQIGPAPFTNAAAFSPTDVMPLRIWAKMTMMLQAVISLVLAVMVVSWAINNLK